MFKYRNTPAAQARNESRRRVTVGVVFLKKNAPANWQRNLFQVYPKDNGFIALPRFKTAYNAQDVICLAFESCVEFAGADGRMDCWIIAEHFDIDMTACGFISDEKMGISCELLDQCWLEAATSYAAQRMSEYLHPGRCPEPKKRLLPWPAFGEPHQRWHA